MRKLAIVMALATSALATPALARDGAWYIGAEGGGILAEDSDFDITKGTAPGGKNSFSVDTKIGYDFDGIIGYDAGMFRIEGEVSYKRVEVDGLDQAKGSIPVVPSSVYPGGIATGSKNWEGAQGSARSLSGMIATPAP